MHEFFLPVGALVDVFGTRHCLRHEGNGRFSCADNDRPQIIEGLIEPGTQGSIRLMLEHVPHEPERLERVVWLCDQPAEEASNVAGIDVSKPIADHGIDWLVKRAGVYAKKVYERQINQRKQFNLVA